MSPTGIWIPQKPWIHCFSTQQGNSQSRRLKHPQWSNLVTERCTALAKIVRGPIIDLWDKSNWPQCHIPSAWIHHSTNREYWTVRHNTRPSVSTWTTCSEWGMSCPPLNPWPHRSYAWNWMDHNLAEAAPTQSILPFLILSLSLKRSKSKEELEREDKGWKWRWRWR